jgi:hypothetical protein
MGKWDVHLSARSARLSKREHGPAAYPLHIEVPDWTILESKKVVAWPF